MGNTSSSSSSSSHHNHPPPLVEISGPANNVLVPAGTCFTVNPPSADASSFPFSLLSRTRTRGRQLPRRVPVYQRFRGRSRGRGRGHSPFRGSFPGFFSGPGRCGFEEEGFMRRGRRGFGGGLGGSPYPGFRRPGREFGGGRGRARSWDRGPVPVPGYRGRDRGRDRDFSRDFDRERGRRRGRRPLRQDLDTETISSTLDADSEEPRGAGIMRAGGPTSGGGAGRRMPNLGGGGGGGGGGGMGRYPQGGMSMDSDDGMDSMPMAGNPYAQQRTPPQTQQQHMTRPYPPQPPPQQYQQQPRPSYPPPGTHEIAGAMYATPTSNQRREPPVSNRINRTQNLGNQAGPSGHEWIEGNSFLDACICTTNCTCRKGQRVLYRAQGHVVGSGGDNGEGDAGSVGGGGGGGGPGGRNAYGEIRYILKEDVGRDCGDHTACKERYGKSAREKGKKRGKKSSTVMASESTQSEVGRDRDRDRESEVMREVREMRATLEGMKLGQQNAFGMASQGQGQSQVQSPGQRIPYGAGVGLGAGGNMGTATMPPNTLDPTALRHLQLERLRQEQNLLNQQQQQMMLGQQGALDPRLGLRPTAPNSTRHPNPNRLMPGMMPPPGGSISDYDSNSEFVDPYMMEPRPRRERRPRGGEFRPHLPPPPPPPQRRGGGGGGGGGGGRRPAYPEFGGRPPRGMGGRGRGGGGGRGTRRNAPAFDEGYDDDEYAIGPPPGIRGGGRDDFDEDDEGAWEDEDGMYIFLQLQYMIAKKEFTDIFSCRRQPREDKSESSG
ncbi:hypothetical protein CC80DRAFT_198062 [Byssothecium circinans]|uniref:Uncharacterized protein n=1 Tax=Byssothecium circinans TaxID=147558 RepID=A0A6A5UDJ8_9PLEO|nr:hypothetical protein CC80DRAFT_198062 [Byssothecium circinans]